MTKAERRRRRRRRALIRAVVRLLILLFLIFLLILLLIFSLNHLRKKGLRKSADKGKVAALLKSQVAEKMADSGEKAKNTGKEIENTKIENIDVLDNTVQGWGADGQVDKENRPMAALQMQEKYGEEYPVFFIGEKTEPPVIYLTFDLDYENGYTASVLDTLKEKDVKAVFFVTGYYAKQAPDLVERMIEEGQAVGNHCMSHPSDEEEMQEISEEDIMGLHSYIYDSYGYSMHLFRFPSGEWSERGMAIANNCNYKILFYDYAYKDYDPNDQMNPDEALEKALDALHPGAIYLFHINGETNPQILGDFIDQTRAEGYEIALFE